MQKQLEVNNIVNQASPRLQNPSSANRPPYHQNFKHIQKNFGHNNYSPRA